MDGGGGRGHIIVDSALHQVNLIVHSLFKVITALAGECELIILS